MILSTYKVVKEVCHMYYNLSKKEYNEYGKKFNKSFIGKQLYIGYITSFLFGCICMGIMGFDLGYRSIEKFEVTLFDIALIIYAGFSLVECVLKQIEYRKELKQYISEKNK